jgi:four helix bundle protein
MHDFKKLKVWQDAIEISIEIYQITDLFPNKEIYGLCSQLNRASVSISANIAEGAGRNSQKDFNHFLSISLGSSYEIETLIIIATRLGYISKAVSDGICKKIDILQKMIYKLQNSLKL